MRKKKELSYTRKTHIERSSCFNCAWRLPLDNNPKSCVFNICDIYNYTEKPNSHPNCEFYVSDKMLSSHLRQLLGTDKAIREEVESLYPKCSFATFTIPSEEVGDLVEYWVQKGKTPNEIRQRFSLNKLNSQKTKSQIIKELLDKNDKINAKRRCPKT